VTTLFAALAVGVLGMLLVTVLVALNSARHHLDERLSSLTPYTARHGAELQDRLDTAIDVSVRHRDTVTRARRHYDEDVSAETRAVRAALAAEQEGKGHATRPPHAR